MIVVGVFVVYGLLLFADAGIGYLKTGGKALFIAGLCTGTVVIVSGVLVSRGVSAGASIGLGVMLAMMAVFGSRYMKTRAFFPTGLMMILSLMALGAIFRAMR